MSIFISLYLQMWKQLNNLENSLKWSECTEKFIIDAVFLSKYQTFTILKGTQQYSS